MSELVRDTVFGHMLRIITRNKVMRYQEEIDPSLWQKYVNFEKSQNMATHGQTQPPERDPEKERNDEDEDENDDRGQDLSDPEKHDPDRPRLGTQRSSDTQVTGGNRDVNDMIEKKLDPEKGKDAHIVDWWGPNDPENPMNWSRFKRFFVTFEICLLTFSVYIGSAIYSAGEMDIIMVFGVSRVAATLGLSLFVLGYAVGPMVWAPMSEIPQIGRNPVYIGTLILFVVLQVPTALAVNFGMLLAFRFITGFIGSPALAVGGASIGDMYTPSKRTYGLAVWGIGAICGPTLGPLIGGFAAEAKGWSWTIWELTWLCGFTLVLLIFFLPETSSANILYRRARRLRKLTGNEKLVAESELAGREMTPKAVAMIAIVRPFELCFTEPIVFALNMYIGLVYALLYAWFESFPIVFTDIYGFTLGLEGVAYLGILVGVLVCLPFFIWYQYKFVEPRFNEKGEIKPELRLPASFVGAFCLPLCLFWFAWTSRPDIHWIVPIIGTSFFSIGAFLLFNSVLNYLSDAYPDYAASVLAGNDFVRSIIGGVCPLFAVPMYNNLGVGWASSLLGFLSVAFIPIPFVLFFYGETIRKHSKRARHDL